MWLELLGIGCTTRSAVVLEPMTNALSVKSVAVMVAYSWPSRSTISLRTLACISSSFDSGQSVHSCNIRKLSGKQVLQSLQAFSVIANIPDTMYVWLIKNIAALPPFSDAEKLVHIVSLIANHAGT